MNTNQSPRGKKQKTVKRLADDLAAIDSDISSISMGDNEMLSLILNQSLKDVDIKARYPTFYRKLLHNAELRRAFVDALDAVESEKSGEMVSLPGMVKPSLAFLTNRPVQPGIEKLDKNRWKIKWQKTIEQLQAIFSPPELAFRKSNLVEDTWFTILRGETDVEGSLYSVLLECGILDDTSDALSAFLNIAVTLKSATPSPQFPVYATLNWGKYSETLKITEEGRVRFPDIPFTITFDKEYQNIISELKLELVISP
jgi:hypothetical protein